MPDVPFEPARLSLRHFEGGSEVAGVNADQASTLPESNLALGSRALNS